MRFSYAHRLDDRNRVSTLYVPAGWHLRWKNFPRAEVFEFDHPWTPSKVCADVAWPHITARKAH